MGKTSVQRAARVVQTRCNVRYTMALQCVRDVMDGEEFDSRLKIHHDDGMSFVEALVAMVVFDYDFYDEDEG